MCTVVIYHLKQAFYLSCPDDIKYIMTNKTQPKLLKTVCKRAELMRAPFNSSSWPIKITQTNNKKSLSLKKTEQKYRSNLVKLNVEIYSSAIEKVCIFERYILHIRLLIIEI